MSEGPLSWYLNRATGIVLLVLLTASVVLGVLSLGGRPGREGCSTQPPKRTG